MSEDTRLALLLDWVREFEALDDEGQDMHMRTLAGIASLDNEVSAGPFWRALASRTFSKPLGSSSSFVQVLK